ncbi:MAG TPA: alpha/beta hydrolase [Pyrinomonadaceae bacterium]|jgi:pimeloyl-ACP methyl ester carboxylesterase|nr:alpha/beta hydrolase [Pyrinomonadaceae bacterium]
MKKLLRLLLLLVVAAAIAFTVFWYSRPADLDFEEFRAAVPHADASRFADVEGVGRVHYQERGSGRALVLIHGNNSSAYSWSDVFDQLAKEFRVVALDLKGFGFTSKPAGDYRVETQAALVVRLLDELKIERAVLCGSSMGGAVALAAAINYPQRVDALILVGSSAFEETRGGSLAPAYLRWPYIGGAVTALALTSDSLVRQGLRKSFYDESKVTDERVAAYYRPLRTRGGQLAARLVREQRNYTLIENSLDKIRRPTLLIWGAQDRLNLLEDGRRLHSKIAGSQLVVFDNCGHLPQEEMPAAFVREVLSFMKSKAAAGG